MIIIFFQIKNGKSIRTGGSEKCRSMDQILRQMIIQHLLEIHSFSQKILKAITKVKNIRKKLVPVTAVTAEYIELQRKKNKEKRQRET